MYKRYNLDANIGNVKSYDENFDDIELLVCNPTGKTFLIIDEDMQNSYSIEADSYKEAIEKLINHWYPETYEEWAENDDGDCEPCGKFHKAVDFYTITEKSSNWSHEVIQ